MNSYIFKNNFELKHWKNFWIITTHCDNIQEFKEMPDIIFYDNRLFYKYSINDDGAFAQYRTKELEITIVAEKSSEVSPIVTAWSSENQSLENIPLKLYNFK